MTSRLKILSFLLGLSLIYAVYDYIDRNNNDSKSVKVKKRKVKRARTSGVSENSASVRKFKKRLKEKKEMESTKNNIRENIKFSKISDEFNDLEGWSRNPFVKFQNPKSLVKKKEVIEPIVSQKSQEPQVKSFELNALDKLNIETAVRMGERAFVTINGKTFREGDLIEDALIEKIENEQVTFRVGTTTIIKNVGI
tara:strand:+ start:18787 stop:19374 length:588 start_codon:yes stop_codon:yes gene_type:complete